MKKKFFFSNSKKSKVQTMKKSKILKKKTCPPEKILNPKTNRCIKKKKKKECPPNKVLNPVTNRCIKAKPFTNFFMTPLFYFLMVTLFLVIYSYEKQRIDEKYNRLLNTFFPYFVVLFYYTFFSKDGKNMKLFKVGLLFSLIHYIWKGKEFLVEILSFFAGIFTFIIEKFILVYAFFKWLWNASPTEILEKIVKPFTKYICQNIKEIWKKITTVFLLWFAWFKMIGLLCFFGDDSEECNPDNEDGNDNDPDDDSPDDDSSTNDTTNNDTTNNDPSSMRVFKFIYQVFQIIYKGFVLLYKGFVLLYNGLLKLFYPLKVIFNIIVYLIRTIFWILSLPFKLIKPSREKQNFEKMKKSFENNANFQKAVNESKNEVSDSTITSLVESIREVAKNDAETIEEIIYPPARYTYDYRQLGTWHNTDMDQLKEHPPYFLNGAEYDSFTKKLRKVKNLVLKPIEINDKKTGTELVLFYPFIVENKDEAGAVVLYENPNIPDQTNQGKIDMLLNTQTMINTGAAITVIEPTGFNNVIPVLVVPKSDVGTTLGGLCNEGYRILNQGIESASSLLKTPQYKTYKEYLVSVFEYQNLAVAGILGLQIFGYVTGFDPASYVSASVAALLPGAPEQVKEGVETVARYFLRDRSTLRRPDFFVPG